MAILCANLIVRKHFNECPKQWRILVNPSTNIHFIWCDLINNLFETLFLLIFQLLHQLNIETYKVQQY